MSEVVPPSQLFKVLDSCMSVHPVGVSMGDLCAGSIALCFGLWWLPGSPGVS